MDSNFCDSTERDSPGRAGQGVPPIGRTHTEAVAERMKNPEYREEYERIKQRRELRERGELPESTP